MREEPEGMYTKGTTRYKPETAFRSRGTASSVPKPRQFQEGRDCANPQCNTILSRYNPEDYCGIHATPDPWVQEELKGSAPTCKQCHSPIYLVGRAWQHMDTRIRHRVRHTERARRRARNGG